MNPIKFLTIVITLTALIARTVIKQRLFCLSYFYFLKLKSSIFFFRFGFKFMNILKFCEKVIQLDSNS